MTSEQWRPVPGFPHHEVSDQGRIRRAVPYKALPAGHVLAGYYDKNGYHCVLLGHQNRNKTVKIHRTVVEAFVGPIPEGMQVNHKNGVKNDNRLENLEIVTPSQNVLHGWRSLGRKPGKQNPRLGEQHHNARFTAEQVREIRALCAAGLTQKEVAARLQTHQSHISKIMRGEIWRHVS